MANYAGLDSPQAPSAIVHEDQRQLRLSHGTCLSFVGVLCVKQARISKIERNQSSGQNQLNSATEWHLPLCVIQRNVDVSMS